MPAVYSLTQKSLITLHQSYMNLVSSPSKSHYAYLMLNGIVLSYLSTKFVKRSETHSYCTRQNNQLNLPQCRTSAAQCAFRFRATKYWNSLPNDIRNSASIEVFKRSTRLEIVRMQK